MPALHVDLLLLLHTHSYAMEDWSEANEENMIITQAQTLLL